MSALKTLGVICVVFACILVVITLFIAIGFVVRIIAVIAAVIGVLWLGGILLWMAVCELFQKK
jgi:hypothetical protein